MSESLISSHNFHLNWYFFTFMLFSSMSHYVHLTNIAIIDYSNQFTIQYIVFDIVPTQYPIQYITFDIVYNQYTIQLI